MYVKGVFLIGPSKCSHSCCSVGYRTHRTQLPIFGYTCPSTTVQRVLVHAILNVPILVALRDVSRSRPKQVGQAVTQSQTPHFSSALSISIICLLLDGFEWPSWLQNQTRPISKSPLLQLDCPGIGAYSVRQIQPTRELLV